MHLQLYSTTNHIVWHISNGITGALFMACANSASGLEWYAFGTAYIAAYLLFYVPYNVRLSYQACGLRA